MAVGVKDGPVSSLKAYRKMASRTCVLIACIAILPALALLPNSAAAASDQPPNVCKPGVTDDTARPLPASLIPEARRLFQVDMPDDLIRKTTVYRCMNGHTLLCTTGANLSCGKANLTRDPAGTATWCRDHQNADNIPMFVTGHDTIYQWRCTNATPAIVATTQPVDQRGFLSRNWKDASP